MRLYLSSSRLGDRAGALLALLGNGRRCALIGNDYGPEVLARTRAEFASLGIVATPLDLGEYFGDPHGLRQRLARVDLVWVMGQDSFALRCAMQHSGFDDIIVDLLDSDEIVYGGEGAGAIVAAPTLEGMHLVHDSYQYARPVGGELVPDGLGLVDHAIVPHYRSAHPLSAAAERAVRHLCARGLRYRALRDGEVLVWTETRVSRAVRELRIAG